MLLEGTSIRSVERLTGVNRNTILSLVLLVGERCEQFSQSFIQGVPCQNIQCDEVWSFIGCKEKKRIRRNYSEEFGDCYTFTAIERDSKLLLAYAIGKRDNATTMEFVRRLKRAVFGTDFQLSTDGFPPYRSVMPIVFGYGLAYAMVIKVFGQPAEGEARYSPPEIIDLHVTPVTGNPDPVVGSPCVDRW
jgi:IS1 family transposase